MNKNGISSASDWQYRLKLPSRIIGSTRGLLTTGTRARSRDSEVCDSHATIRPRELSRCFQSRRSSQHMLYKELHPVTCCISRVGASALSPLSASAFVTPCMIQNKGPRRHRRKVLHVCRNHVITAILRRKNRPMGEIFIFLLLKIQHFFQFFMNSLFKVILLPPSGMG